MGRRRRVEMLSGPGEIDGAKELVDGVHVRRQRQDQALELRGDRRLRAAVEGAVDRRAAVGAAAVWLEDLVALVDGNDIVEEQPGIVAALVIDDARADQAHPVP